MDSSFLLNKPLLSQHFKLIEKKFEDYKIFGIKKEEIELVVKFLFSNKDKLMANSLATKKSWEPYSSFCQENNLAVLPNKVASKIAFSEILSSVFENSQALYPALLELSPVSRDYLEALCDEKAFLYGNLGVTSDIVKKAITILIPLVSSNFGNPKNYQFFWYRYLDDRLKGDAEHLLIDDPVNRLIFMDLLNTSIIMVDGRFANVCEYVDVNDLPYYKEQISYDTSLKILFTELSFAFERYGVTYQNLFQAARFFESFYDQLEEEKDFNVCWQVYLTFSAEAKAFIQPNFNSLPNSTPGHISFWEVKVGRNVEPYLGFLFMEPDEFYSLF